MQAGRSTGNARPSVRPPRDACVRK